MLTKLIRAVAAACLLAAAFTAAPPSQRSKAQVGGFALQGGACDPYYAYTTLILNFDNTLTDTSPVAAAFTNNGSTPFSNSVTPFVGHYAFGPMTSNGQGTTSTANSGAVNFLASSFTMEGLVYPTATGQSNGSFVVVPNASVGTPYVAINPGTYQLGYGHAGSAPLINSSINFTPNSWNYWAVIRSGTTVSMYVANSVPGSPSFAGSVSDSTSFSGVSKLNLGGSASTVQLLGSIGPTRITSGVVRTPIVPTVPFPAC
jgi:hypothetical protein